MCAGNVSAKKRLAIFVVSVEIINKDSRTLQCFFSGFFDVHRESDFGLDGTAQIG